MFARRAHAVFIGCRQPARRRPVCLLASLTLRNPCISSKPRDCMGYPSSALLRCGLVRPSMPRSVRVPMDPDSLSMDRQQKTPDISRAIVHPRTRLELKLVRPEGFEPPTNGFGSHYSIRLSYERLAAHYARTAGMRVMGPGGAGPGEPRRHSRRHDTGLSARAVGGSQPDAQVRAHRIQAVQRCPSQAAVPRKQARSTSQPDRA